MWKFIENNFGIIVIWASLYFCCWLVTASQFCNVPTERRVCVTTALSFAYWTDQFILSGEARGKNAPWINLKKLLCGIFNLGNYVKAFMKSPKSDLRIPSKKQPTKLGHIVRAMDYTDRLVSCICTIKACRDQERKSAFYARSNTFVVAKINVGKLHGNKHCA